jgi:hypothetical protein
VEISAQNTYHISVHTLVLPVDGAFNNDISGEAEAGFFIYYLVVLDDCHLEFVVFCIRRERIPYHMNISSHFLYTNEVIEHVVVDAHAIHCVTWKPNLL